MKKKHESEQGTQTPDSGAAGVDALFEKARGLHAAGRLAEAEPLYRQVLQAYPEHPDALHLLGVLAYQVGFAAPALELIDKAVEARPEFADAHFSRGNARYALQQYQAALESYDEAIRQRPLYAEALCNRGSALRAIGQFQAAVESYDEAIQIKPDYVDAYANRGNTLGILGKHQAAADSFDEVILLRPDFVDAYYNRGAAEYALGQYEKAAKSFGKAAELRPDYAEAYVSRGNALHALGRCAEALERYDGAIRLKPDLPEAHSNRGSALFALERYAEALESFDKAIALKPDNADPHSNRGAALHAVKKYEESLKSCDTAIGLNPLLADAHYNRGNALHGMERHEEALESYDRALRLGTLRAEVHNNRGGALLALQRYPESLASYDEAIRLRPDYADGWFNRGNALQSMKQYEAALECYDKAILLKTEYPEAWFNRGNILQNFRKYHEVLKSYDEAMRLKPDYEYAQGLRMHMRGFLCDWEGLDAERRNLEERILRGEKASVPFPVLSISSSLEVQRKAAEIQVQDKFPARAGDGPIPQRARRDKIRIGYYSADYHNHATSYLIAELLERHDRNRFEIVGFSFGPNADDGMSRRVTAAMDRFVDVRAMPDRDVTKLSRELEIDIAVDLKGFTQDCRTGIFAGRAAPIQVNYLGYPGTMGAEYIDYLIADPTLIPEESRKFYSEKIAYLPDSYQVNDTRRAVAEKICTRAEEGLPETGFVYCCFNNAYKISPEVFDVWMRVLGRVEGSVLWLLEENTWEVANLRKEAARRGIAPERLVFAGRVDLADHLARHKLADLVLDTLPYNAHTTASDALWVGVPVLTRLGPTFAGRVAASLLRATGLPELVTGTESEYEELAVSLGQDKEWYGALRRRVEENRLGAALFDIEAFTGHLEAAYSAMYERYQAGLRPEHIEVARLGR